ncbi:MAG: aminotransferase class I/II-fold pyridoxal phosphate-dependent enzyme, partial [Intestinibacter sp.]
MKEVKYAKRMMVEGGSEISDILALTAKPEVISFAGGLPAPELFPVADMKRMANEVLDEVGTVALQYSSAQGFPKFRQQIADRMNAKQKTNVAADDILVTSGSQQALEFSGKIFIDEGDVILCESPTYLGAL